MILFEKVFTREHSLFYCSVWSESNLKHMAEWIGGDFKNLLFLREAGSNRITVWYEVEETKWWFKAIAEKCLSEPDFVQRVISAFHRHSEFLLAYIREEKALQSILDLEKFYNEYFLWWSPMAVIFTIPKLEQVPQELRDQALRVREETHEYAELPDKVFLDFFTKKYPEYADIAWVISPEEIFQLKTRKLTNEEHEQIRKRLSGYALLNGELFLLNELDKKLKELNIVLEQPPAETKELTGDIAMKGKAQGRVRLILHKEQISEFHEGEILVTENTEPSFLPAMKKAAAIVTDEGGITSHAAIVSRELKKPCIIGTKIATKAFKDGDMVEVDAEKGVVRKVS